MKKPTKQQIKERAQRWADALRKNRKKAISTMRAYGGRCCLAVAVDVMSEDTGIDRSTLEDDECPYPPVLEYFGTRFDLLTPDGIEAAAVINDGTLSQDPVSHKIIAECVENTHCRDGRKKPVWSRAALKAFGVKP
jgi:hypothetical protein